MEFAIWVLIIVVIVQTYKINDKLYDSRIFFRESFHTLHIYLSEFDKKLESINSSLAEIRDKKTDGEREEERIERLRLE